MTEEHVFPEAIGGTLTIRTLCKPCNDRLGHSVDATVTNHTLVEIKRQQLGLSGKTGVIPNPFERAVLADEPDRKVRLDLSKPGPAGMYLHPSVKKTETEPGKGSLAVSIDASDAHRLGEIVNKALARAGAPPISEEQLERNISRIEQPRLTIPLAFDVGQYRRGLMKIVYELACTWLGDKYADESAAATLREFIFDTELPFDPSEKYAIPGKMTFLSEQPLLPFWQDARDHLTACSIDNGNTIGIYVSVLGVLEAMVCVTTEPERYRDAGNRFVTIDPRTGVRRESSFEEEVRRICGD